jgi:hypothetical protein
MEDVTVSGEEVKSPPYWEYVTGIRQRSASTRFHLSCALIEKSYEARQIQLTSLKIGALRSELDLQSKEISHHSSEAFCGQPGYGIAFFARASQKFVLAIACRAHALAERDNGQSASKRKFVVLLGIGCQLRAVCFVPARALIVSVANTTRSLVHAVCL